MLRDEIRHRPIENTQARSQALHRGTDALLEAKAQFEFLLAHNDVWRELKHIESCCDDGLSERTDDARVLRDRLTRALASEPAFIAWQFVEAALACLALDAATRAGATDPGKSDAAAGDREAREARGLASRIPTLERIDLRERPEQEIERPNPYDDDSTHFTSAAVGIEEAQVKIVVRKPAKPLIEFSLPPLPFARKSASSDSERRADPAATAGGERHPKRADEAEISIVPARPTTR